MTASIGTAIDLASKVLAARAGDSWGIVTPRANGDLALRSVTGNTPAPIVVAVLFLAVGLLAHGALLTTSLRLSGRAYGLLVGGVIGNAIDRAATGVVHDWLHVGPVVLNVADCLIAAGLAAYLVVAWSTAGDSRLASATPTGEQVGPEGVQPVDGATA